MLRSTFPTGTAGVKRGLTSYDTTKRKQTAVLLDFHLDFLRKDRFQYDSMSCTLTKVGIFSHYFCSPPKKRKVDLETNGPKNERKRKHEVVSQGGGVKRFVFHFIINYFLEHFYVNTAAIRPKTEMGYELILDNIIQSKNAR